MFKREHKNDPAFLRELYELVEDREALAALSRQAMGQGEKVEVTDVRPRHG